MQSTNTTNTYITFSAGKSLFAIDTQYIRYITARDMLSSRPVPTLKGDTKEVFDYQGHVITLYRFCEAIGVESQADSSAALVEMLRARRQDHIDWVDALEHSIRTGEAFTKATDPHQCAFGKWYDNYRPEDPELAKIMKAFDAPHKHIHALAERLLKQAEQSETLDGALSELAKERGSTLRELLKLFNTAAIRLEDMVKPVVLVIDGGERTFALEIESVRDIREFSEQEQIPEQDSGDNAIHQGYFKGRDEHLHIHIDPALLRYHLEKRFPIEIPKAG
jgi:chemotaxis signal transduction protein